MDVGIIGAGKIGQAAAARLVTAGHQVVIANSRGPETLAEVEQALGQAARAGTIEEAAAFGPVVIVAIPLKAIGSLPAAALAGKVVIDANNYYPGRDGQFEEIDNGAAGSSELLARALPDAKVVKAFNTMRFDHLRERGLPAGAHGRLALPIAGDDPEAKATISALIDDMGFDAVDGGDLAAGRRQEPDTPVYGQVLDADGVRAALARG